jgi:hypothetical protein
VRHVEFFPVKNISTEVLAAPQMFWLNHSHPVRFAEEEAIG